MKHTKMMRVLAAGIVSAFVLAATGIVGNDVSVVEAAPAAMNVQASISGKDVNVVASATAAPASDDGMLYLFAEPIYSDTITTNALASAPAAANATFTTPLNADSADSRLYSKFFVAAVQGGQYVPLNPGAYIVNPEAIATNTFARTETGLKGLLIDPAKLSNGELQDLGVKQVLYNISVNRMLGPTDNPSYPTINYTYNGKTYQMNGVLVAEYEHIFGTLSRNGIQITAIFLNENNGRNGHFLHPLSRDGFASPHYALNTAEPQAVEDLIAVASFCAEHYSNEKNGKVDNWIVGNEVNKRYEWNYVNISDLNAYANEYAEAVRLCYNAIKSKNANAHVNICTDQQWDRNTREAGKYDAKDFINAFNSAILAGGNIDWGLMNHPYPVPLTWAAYWTGGGYYKNLVKHNENSAYVTMENIEVLTDYMCRPELLNPAGQVRSIQVGAGYNTSQGENYACAAMVLAYQQAINNQHIDTFIFSRQSDIAAEIPQGLVYGLTNVDGSHKTTYDCYKNLDGPNAAAYLQQALALRGVSDLSQVIIPR